MSHEFIIDTWTGTIAQKAEIATHAAKALNSEITLRFNGLRLKVKPSDELDDVVQEYNELHARRLTPA